jgi:glycosyltransferase involved in cell wall biosynthesis
VRQSPRSRWASPEADILHTLVVSDVFLPRVNGVSTSIRSFCGDLARHGIASTLVAPAYPQPTEPESGVLRVPARRVPFDPEDCIMNWRALKKCLATLPDERCDLVHIQTPFLAHYAGLTAARTRRVPVVATCHTYFEDYLHHYLPLLPAGAGAWLARRLMTHQLNAVDAVVSPSDPVRQRLQEYGVTRPIHVIPTGMTQDRFVAGDGAAFRATHGIEPWRRIVLNVGRVAHEKNLGFLLRMFARLRTLRKDVLLLIAGEGPARGALEKEARRLGIAADTRFIGNLDRERGLNDCYAAADVFVFASRTETQGLVLLEAMAQARPVVSTACLGTRSVLTAGSGACVADEVEEDFAAAVAGVLADPVRARCMGGKGEQWARQWSSLAQAGHMADMYRDLKAGVLCRAKPRRRGADLPGL